MPIFQLSKDKIAFPPVHLADRMGVLAVGGDLSEERLLLAYSSGIFPWYNPDEPILWWCPDPRFVLFPDELKVQKSMRPYFNQQKFSTTYDQAFKQVMENCQQVPRRGQPGTWITPELIESFCALHERGYAHSVEVWDGEELVGGLYGLSFGKCFFGESMFAKASNASKFGFITLVRDLREQHFKLIDCQVKTRHLESMGARPIPRIAFMHLIRRHGQGDQHKGNWGKWLGRDTIPSAR